MDTLDIGHMGKAGWAGFFRITRAGDQSGPIPLPMGQALRSLTSLDRITTNTRSISLCSPRAWQEGPWLEFQRCPC